MYFNQDSTHESERETWVRKTVYKSSFRHVREPFRKRKLVMEYCKFHSSMFISTFSCYFNNNLGLPISAYYRAMFKNKKKPEQVPCRFCSLLPVQAADPRRAEVRDAGVCACFSPVDAAAGQEEGTSRGVPLPAHSFRSSPSASRVDSGPVLPQCLRDLSQEASPCSSASAEASKCSLRPLQLKVCD